MAASAGAARRWAPPGTSSTNCTGGPGPCRATETSPSGHVPTGAIGPRHAQLARDQLEHHLVGPRLPLPLQVPDHAAEPPEPRRHRDQPGVVHPPRLDPRPGHRRSLAPVTGTDRLPRTIVPMKATSGELPIGEGWTYEVKWDGMRALAFVERQQLRVQSYNERDVTVSWPELAGLPDAVPATTAAARRRAGGHRRRGPTQLRAAATAHARHRSRRGRRPRRRGAGGLRGVRPAPPRRHQPLRPRARRIGAGCWTSCSSRVRAGACRRSHDDGPALLDAAARPWARRGRRQAPRLPLRTRTSARGPGSR